MAKGTELREYSERDRSYEEALRNRRRALLELGETFAVLLRVDIAAGEALAEDPPRSAS